MDAIVERVHALLDARDARERDCFVSAFEHCSKLTRLQKELKNKNFRLEKRLSDASARGETSDPMTEAHVKSMELKLKQKDEDLQRMYRQQAKNTQKMLDMTDKAQQGAKDLEKRMLEVKQLKDKIESNMSEVEEAKRVRVDTEAKYKLVMKELESQRDQMKEAHGKIQSLAKENSTLVERILKMKMQQAEQMNQMNDMYENALKAAQKNAQAAITESKSRQEEMADKTKILDSASWSMNFNVQVPERNTHALRVHKGQASAVAFDRRGKLLATCGTDSVVRVFDVKTKTPQDTLNGHNKAILDLEFSPDDRFLMASGNDSRVLLWSTRTGRQVQSLTGHTNKICACSFSPDASRAYTGSHDRTIRFWDLQSSSCKTKISCGSAVNYLSVCSGGNIIGTAHLDNSVRLWSTRDGERIAMWKDIHTRQATSVEFSNDGIYAVTNSRDNTLRIIDVRTYNSVKVLRAPGYKNAHNWNNATFSPDGKYVVAGGRNTEIYFWDVKTGKLKSKLSSTNDTVTSQRSSMTSTKWSPTGQAVCTSDNAGYLLFWEASPMGAAS